jgi:hypothetical protein
MQDCNSFEKPDAVKIGDFSGASLVNGSVVAVLPAKSVVTLEIL